MQISPFEELQKLYLKDQKNCRSCMERTRSTLEDVWKRPEELQKLYGKDQKYSKRCMEFEWLQKQCGKVKKNYRSCNEKTRKTTEAVWKGTEALKKLYRKDRSTPEVCMESDYRSRDGKIQKNYRSCIEKTRRTAEVVWKGPEVLQKMYGILDSDYRSSVVR
jgi:hypothetical protein